MPIIRLYTPGKKTKPRGPGGIKRLSDSRYAIGRKAPASGIYRCGDCGRRITMKKGKPFPPCHDGWFMAEVTTVF
jgi:hypothetical protein